MVGPFAEQRPNLPEQINDQSNRLNKSRRFNGPTKRTPTEDDHNQIQAAANDDELLFVPIAEANAADDALTSPQVITPSHWNRNLAKRIRPIQGGPILQMTEYASLMRAKPSPVPRKRVPCPDSRPFGKFRLGLWIVVVIRSPWEVRHVRLSPTTSSPAAFIKD